MINLTHSQELYLEVLLDNDKYNDEEWKRADIIGKIKWLQEQLAAAQAQLASYDH